MKLNSNMISLAALIVSISSALFSYMQSRTSAAQLHLNEQQLRPYIKYIPTFFKSKNGIGIDMHLENLSPLPAKVLHTELTAWIDGEHVGVDFHSTSPDLLYQHKGGLSSLPPIEGKLFRRLEHRGSTFTIAVCVVYTSSSEQDPRTWLHQALYDYEPGLSLPKTQFIDETDIDPIEQKCSAKKVRDRFETTRHSTPAKL